MFVHGGAPTPHPFSSRPHFVCNLVAKGAPKFFKTLTELDIPYFANAYSCTVLPIDLHNF
jgi:hypothetical protein